MPTMQERILSYQLATVLNDNDLKDISGGTTLAVTTIGTQKMVGTRGGDSTIHFDNYDSI